AARAGRAAGALVSFDGNFRPRLWAAWDADPAAILRQLLAEADLAFADHRDIAVALGDDPAAEATDGHEARIIAAAARAFAAFPRLQRIATTLRTQHSVDRHSLGALMATRDGEVRRAPPRALEGIVDRIGAGDAFAAGLLHGLLTGMGDDEALRFGLVAACLKHSQPGDMHLASAEEIAACAREEPLDVRR
ncbi:PfkB family carbohydrate kinase, partial [Luteimonas salinisoli]|uniref:PfkB family carbohydrate kinase n=1 Tax=Luteimonas salinisoli TaxID=2752307 RepID=UPI00214D6DCA